MALCLGITNTSLAIVLRTTMSQEVSAILEIVMKISKLLEHMLLG